MTTKYKIITGFIVMILLVAGMAALGYYELQQSSNGFISYRSSARANVNASDMEARLYLSVAKTYDYIITKDQEKLNGATSLADAFAALAKETENEVDTQERLSVLQGLQKQAGLLKGEQLNVGTNSAALQKRFLEGVRPNYVLMMGKINDLAESARGVDNTQLLFAIHEVWHDFSLALAFIGRFAQSGMPEEGKMALERINTVEAPLDRMGGIIQTPQGRKIHGELVAAYKTLRDTANAMAGDAREMVASINDMRTLEAGMSGAAATFNREIDANMRAIGSKVLDDNAKAQVFLMILSAVGLVIGAALAALIIFGIIRVLNDLSAFAAAVSGGNFAYAAKTREKGEIGTVIAAMQQIPAVLNGMIEMSKTLANDINTGNLRSRGDVRRLRGTFVDLGDAINGICSAFTDIIDALPMPVMTCDSKNKVRFFNKAGQAVVGGEHVGAGCKDLLNAPECGGAQCLGNLCMNKKEGMTHETSIHPQGRKMDISVSAQPLTDMSGATAGYIEIITDLTEIKQQQRTMLDVAAQASEISNRVAAASEELSAQVEEVSRGAEMQRSRVESTASAMTEMNATVLEVARSAGQAADQSDSTRQKAIEGAELVTKVIASINAVNAIGQKLRGNMEELGTQAESIGGVMNVISDIADQTNLLALNAAIEAARAGEAGRGFAVVADEVRKLAEKTMQATQEVGASINAVQHSARVNVDEVGKAVSSVEEANGLANSSGEALSTIVELASANSAVVASIATAAEEQSATSEEINSAVDEINRVVAETAEGMVQSSAAVQELSHMAQELRRVMDHLK